MKIGTKLITLDYDEYIGLLAIKNNSELEILIKLNKELNKLPNFFDYDRKYDLKEIKNIINNITLAIDHEIMKLNKEIDAK